MNEMHPTHQYAHDVVYGDLREKCCIYEILSCKRHLDDLNRQGDDDFPYVFDETRADRIFKWFEICRHVRGAFAGQPIKLLPWQKFDQGTIYGWVHKDTGARRFLKTYNKRARGNVKSTEVSGKCLYHMCSDAIYPPGKPEMAEYEMSPEIECSAVDRGQADRVFRDCAWMAFVSPQIKVRLNRFKPDTTRRLVHKKRGGFIRALSKDTKNKDSGAPCYFDVDEYHAHPTSAMYDIGFSGFGKRKQSLLEIITTAGEDASNKPCKKEEDYAKSILRGENQNDRYFIMIRELDEGDNVHDKTTWVKPNPMLRYDDEYSKTLLEQIEMEYSTAYDSGDPDKIRNFLTRRMDLWREDSEAKYMSGYMDKWDSLAVSKKEFLKLIKNKSGNVGLDLSKKIDLTADGIAILLSDGRIAVDAHGFMPQETVIMHELKDKQPYSEWAEDGWLTVTPGAVTDFDEVLRHMEGIPEEYGMLINEIDFDPYEGTYFSQVLEKRFKGINVVEIPQTIPHLSPGTKKFREMVASGKIVHCGNPLLRMALKNAVTYSDGNDNIRISKKNKDDTQRVDPLAAVINSFSRVYLSDNTNEIIKSDDWSL